jgi:glycosyltransferase involved in cell wall biosynthesis
MPNIIDKISVIIPVFNEAGNIGALLRRVKNVPVVNEIVVVDDCSTDGTGEMLRGLEKEIGFKLAFHEKNRGKGAAIKTGLDYVTGGYAVIQDADFEYNPEEYRILIDPITKGEADVAYGSRFLGRRADTSPLYNMGNKFLTVLTNLLYGSRLTDMETCYKLMPVSFLKTIEFKANRFDFEPEITAKILKAGLKIREVPISYSGRSKKEGKKISWIDGFSAVKILLKCRFNI